MNQLTSLIDNYRQQIKSVCPKIDIKDRMCLLYSSHIRSIKYALGQYLQQPQFTLARCVPLFLLCSDISQKTFGDFFEGAKGISEVENETISLPNALLEDDENEVLQQIDLEDWEVTPPHDELPPDTEFGIVCDRYSSDAQNDTGCVARVKTMLNIAEEEGVKLYTNPIVEIAESGKSIRREGLKEIVQLLQHPQVKYLFVHDVDRIARWNAFCIFLTELVTREFDIEIYTSQGELDLTRLKGLATTWVESMAGEIDNRKKARRTLDGQIENFEDGSDGIWYRGKWIGYASSDSNLKQIEDKEVEVAKEMFKMFDQAPEDRPYKATLEHLHSEHKDILEDALADSDDSDEDEYLLKQYRLKTMLADPIYIGKPIAKGESIGDQGQQAQLDKPNLQIINEDLFQRVNDKLERVEKQYSDTSSPGEIMDLDYLLHEFGLLPVGESSEQVAVFCPDCEIPMDRNKTSSLEDEQRRVPVYVCPECKREAEENDNDEKDISGNYKTFPNSYEIYKIRLFDRVMENLPEVAKFLKKKGELQ